MDSAGGLLHTGYHYGAQFTPEKRPSDAKTGEHFVIEDLLDFPSDDGGAGAAVAGVSTESSTPMAVENTSVSSVSTAEDLPVDTYNSVGIGCHFSGDLRVPYDDVAELEWLSNFVEESFSSEEELQKLHLIHGIKAPPHHHINPQVPVPLRAKARSKRSRAANGTWASRLLSVAPPSQKKKEFGSDGGEGRRCFHCAADKTPQWRTGPMGPKTLCNACGVRYKSGRLVPEYRPAASPTFVLTKHSNSHRKVLELRRQKEMLRAHHHHHPQFMGHRQNVMLDASNGDDYLIHQAVGPDFRQLI